jgi:hypothetical protein
MTGLPAAINAIYDQVGAPPWAEPNLDGLADVLRDLSWLPEGTVAINVPDVAGPDYGRLLAVLLTVIDEVADTARPVVLVP